MGTDCQSSKFEPLDGYRLPILPSELLTTSRSLEAGSGKVFFKEDDLEVLRVSLPCPNIKLAICSRTPGNLFAHFNGRHKEVKFAQNRASPSRGTPSYHPGHCGKTVLREHVQSWCRPCRSRHIHIGFRTRFFQKISFPLI